jgi:hypothetical protein
MIGREGGLGGRFLGFPSLYITSFDASTKKKNSAAKLNQWDTSIFLGAGFCVGRMDVNKIHDKTAVISMKNCRYKLWWTGYRDSDWFDYTSHYEILKSIVLNPRGTLQISQ